jgi:hypothetical protein
MERQKLRQVNRSVRRFTSIIPLDHTRNFAYIKKIIVGGEKA